MNARTILIEWLQAHNCDGLCYERTNDSCGCGLDDLMPCLDPRNLSECVPAVKVEPDAEQQAEGCTVAYAPANLGALCVLARERNPQTWNAPQNFPTATLAI